MGDRTHAPKSLRAALRALAAQRANGEGHRSCVQDVDCSGRNDQILVNEFCGCAERLL